MFAMMLDVKASAYEQVIHLCSFSVMYELGPVVFLRGSGCSGAGRAQEGTVCGRGFVEVD